MQNVLLVCSATYLQEEGIPLDNLLAMLLLLDEVEKESLQIPSHPIKEHSLFSTRLEMF
jgi:hypothetical protein